MFDLAWSEESSIVDRSSQYPVYEESVLANVDIESSDYFVCMRVIGICDLSVCLAPKDCTRQEYLFGNESTSALRRSVLIQMLHSTK